MDHCHSLNQPKIVYLLDSFPILSQTFVLQEILELQRQGLSLQVFSLFEPSSSETAKGEWRGHIPISYISHQSRLNLLAMTVRRFFKTPRRFLDTTLLTLSHHPLRSALSYLCDGVFVAEQIERQKIAHLHAHFASGGASVAQIVHLLTGIPYSFMTHAYDIYLSRQFDLAYKMRMAHFVATCSIYNQQHLQALVDQHVGERIHCVYCGLNLDLFPADADPAPGLEKLSCILAVGRLIEKKGLLYLVLACRMLKDQGYDFTCRIVGNGPERLLLEQKYANWL